MTTSPGRVPTMRPLSPPSQLAAPLPTTTKAWTFTRPGQPRSVLTLSPSHPLPPFPPHQSQQSKEEQEYLLLRVSHTALNPADAVTLSVLPFFLRSHHRAPFNLPSAVPCADFTATVLDVYSPTPATNQSGQGGGKFKKGDRVVCFPVLPHLLKSGQGGLQGIVALPPRYAVRIPEGKTTKDAAGLLLAGCTADVQVSEAGIKPGQRVLVIGASGGVGSMAVQMVREKVGPVGEGGWVVGVCSGKNEGMVKGLGVDEVIDYTRYPSLPAELARRFASQPFDNIIDCFGNQAVYKHCAQYLKPQGMYNAASIHYSNYTFWALLKSGLTILANTLWPRSPWLGGTGRTWKAASMMDPGQEAMQRVVDMFGEGKLRVAVDSEWPFEKVHEAFDVLYSGHAAGKVIIKVNEDEDEE